MRRTGIPPNEFIRREFFLCSEIRGELMRGVITANWTIFSHYDSPKRFALLWCGNLGGVVSNRFLFLPRSLGK